MERMRIWETIAAAVDVNCSGDFAKKRWLQLRDRYRKELKTAIKHNFVTPIRWCYFSHLSWLDPYLKDNLVLSTCDGYAESGDSFSNCVDSIALNSVKTELDDADREQSTSPMEPSVIDRLLASTHHLSRSQKDTCDDQSVSASGAEEETKTEQAKCEETTTTQQRETPERKPESIQVPQSVSATALKTQIAARQLQLEQIIVKQAVSTGRSIMDWMNDEDFLYCRIIGLRLKKMDARKRKRVRAQIMSLLEESEGELDDDDDSMSSPNVDIADSSVFDHSVLDVAGKFGDR
ncbi:hypothetical protein Q1695_013361 [Nippostrongylus brasiliensis]|nr:hypothetical protein Q1695_013361 [Nippostrongylus brasiliensis]